MQQKEVFVRGSYEFNCNFDRIATSLMKIAHQQSVRNSIEILDRLYETKTMSTEEYIECLNELLSGSDLKK